LQGFTPRETLLFVEDTLQIIREEGGVTTHRVNRNLRKMGWYEASVDRFTFELIIEFLKSEGEYGTEKMILH